MAAVAESVMAFSEVSLWVINQMMAIRNFLGVSFDRVEKQVIDLFTTLEREISFSGSGEENCRRK